MSKQYMAFVNKGEVPINAFKLLGASNKRNDNSKIGFFGTGLKYALAVLLREGVEFRVFSGMKEVKIGTRTTDFLGDKVQVITVNNEKTSITVDAGIDWEGWFAIREIYSNAVDEGGSVDLADIDPEAGHTKIYIEVGNNKLGDVFSNWQKYFAGKRPTVYENSSSRVLNKMPGNAQFLAYRKGILAHEQKKMDAVSLFDYDLHFLEINESRVAKYPFQVWQMASSLLAACTDVKVITSFIDLSKDNNRGNYTEWQDEFWEYTGSFSKEWREVIADRQLVPNDYAGRFEPSTNSLVLPDRLVKKLREYFGKQIKMAGEDSPYIKVEDEAGMGNIRGSLKRLAAIGYPYGGEVLIVTFKDKMTLGLCDDGKIMISETATRLSDRDLDLVVFEEIVHHDTGLQDCSRELQTYLFKQILNMSTAARAK